MEFVSGAAHNASQALLETLNRTRFAASGAPGLPAEGRSTMLLQLLAVTCTFALSCAGGWLFSSFYFARVREGACVVGRGGVRHAAGQGRRACRAGGGMRGRRRAGCAGEATS